MSSDNATHEVKQQQQPPAQPLAGTDNKKPIKTTHDYLELNPCLPRRRFDMYALFKNKPQTEWYKLVKDARDLPACKGCGHQLDPRQAVLQTPEGFGHGTFIGPGYWFCLPTCLFILAFKKHGVQSAGQLTWINKMLREYYGCAAKIPVFDEDNFVKNGGTWTYAEYRQWAIATCWPDYATDKAAAADADGKLMTPPPQLQMPPVLRSVPFVTHAVVLEESYRAPLPLATDLVRQDRINLETAKLKDKQAKKQASEEKKQLTKQQRAEAKRIRDEAKKMAKEATAAVLAAARAEKERTLKEAADAKAKAAAAGDEDVYLPPPPPTTASGSGTGASAGASVALAGSSPSFASAVRMDTSLDDGAATKPATTTSATSATAWTSPMSL